MPSSAAPILHGQLWILPVPSNVQEIALREALEERYLAYALHHHAPALPDARMPCRHRRLLMPCGIALTRAVFKKSARVVGDVSANTIRTATSRCTTRWRGWRDSLAVPG
jgi:hypothetical protein